MAVSQPSIKSGWATSGGVVSSCPGNVWRVITASLASSTKIWVKCGPGPPSASKSLRSGAPLDVTAADGNRYGMSSTVGITVGGAGQAASRSCGVATVVSAARVMGGIESGVVDVVAAGLVTTATLVSLETGGGVRDDGVEIGARNGIGELGRPAL